MIDGKHNVPRGTQQKGVNILIIGLEYIAKEYRCTYREIAQKLNVSPAVINDWVNKYKKIPKKRVEQLSGIFNLPEDFFQKELTAPEKIEISIQRLKSLSDSLPKTSYDSELFIDYDKIREDAHIHLVKEEYNHWKTNIENSKDRPISKMSIDEIKADSFAKGFVSAINKLNILS